MQLYDPLVAIVRVPHRDPGDDQDDPLGDAMKRIRIWLDGAGIQTTTFHTMVDGRGFTLKIGFQSAGDVERFRSQFSGTSEGAASRPPASAEGVVLSS